jgi:hypothetical protein
MPIKFDKNVPIPARKKQSAYAHMEVGDSLGGLTEAEANNTCLAIAYVFGKGAATRRRMPDGTYRVWRADNNQRAKLTYSRGGQRFEYDEATGAEHLDDAERRLSGPENKETENDSDKT